MFMETMEWSIWNKDWPQTLGMGGCGTQGAQFGLSLFLGGGALLVIVQLPAFLV